MSFIFNIYLSFIRFIKARLTTGQFIIISGMLVGLTSGIAAVVLKTIVHYLQRLLSNNWNFSGYNYFYLIFPMIGIFLASLFTKVFLKGKLSKGAGYVILYIEKKLSNLEKQSVYSHIVTSSLTVGFGGSAGLEAPIVVTGAAIGSNYGRVNLFDYKERTLLLACGSAAGIAAVFNAPIAGVMFALEVLLVDVSLPIFAPLLISSVTGALCSKIILQEDILLNFRTTFPFDYNNIPHYILLGILTGFISLYYAKVFKWVESVFNHFEHKRLLKVIIGGGILAALIYIFPPLFGEGYGYIKLLEYGNTDKLLLNSPFNNFTGDNWFVLSFLGAIILIKSVATSVTLNSGGNGGNFAPSLFVGAFTGFFYSRLMNTLMTFKVPESNFTLVAMAGILSGIMYAPLTGIFLIAELTSGYDLMIPLMIVSSISFLLVKHFEPYSMDTKDLVEKGLISRGDRDKTILSHFNINEIIETDFLPLQVNSNLAELGKIIITSKRNIFPVINSEGKLQGIIYLDNLREILFDLNNYGEVPAVELMSPLPAKIRNDEEMVSVMKKFDDTKIWNLPVVDKNDIYMGFLSKSSILTKYRDELQKLYKQD